VELARRLGLLKINSLMMTKGRWAVAAVLLATVKADLAQRQPAAFNARITDGLQVMYTFQQDECESGAVFQEEDDAGPIGPLSKSSNDILPTGAFNKCPRFEDTANNRRYRTVSNGVSFSGERGFSLTQDESITSSSGAVGNLNLNDEMTVEMWIKPGFSSSSSTGTKEFVLFELGQSGNLASINDVWDCALGKLDFRLTYNDNTANQRFVAYVRTESECKTVEFSSTPLVEGKVYHIVLKLFQEGTLLNYVFFVNNVEDEELDRDDLSATSWSSDGVIRVGSAPSVISSDIAAEGLFHSFDGDILFLALYNRALSDEEVATNFNAWLPNSSPAVPFSDTSGNDLLVLNALEGNTQVVDYSSIAIIDFDDFAELGSDIADFPPAVDASTLEFVLTSEVDPSKVPGSFSFGETPLSPGDTITELSFTPSDENAYGGPATFTIGAKDAFASSVVNSPMSMVVEASNDAPTLNAISFDEDNAVPQSQRVLVRLEARDLDCSASLDQDTILDGDSDTDATSSCSRFGVTFFGINTEPTFGKFFIADTQNENEEADCAGISDPVFVDSYPFTFDAVAPGLLANTYFANICWESCFGTAANGASNPCPEGSEDEILDGIIGVQELDYSVLDNGDASTDSTITIVVESVLKVTPQHYTMIEDQEDMVAITLSGIDFACEDENGNPKATSPVGVDCDNRPKSFQITGIPEASMGTVFRSDKTTLVKEADVIEEAEQLFFKVAPDFFNRDSHPLCYNDFASSVAGFNTCLEPKTFVPVCTAPEGMPDGCTSGTFSSRRYVTYTTTTLTGETMGGCGADATEGCPATLSYFMKIGSEQSQVSDGAKVWVTNLNDAAQLSISLDAPIAGVTADDPEIPLQDEAGQFVTIVDPAEDNMRILELLITVTKGQIQYLNTVQDGGVQGIDVVNSCEIFTGDNCFTVRVQGTSDPLNDFLDNIKFVLLSNLSPGEESAISFALDDIANKGIVEDTTNTPEGFPAKPDVFQVSAAIDFTGGNSTTATRGVSIETIATYAGISTAALMILGSCYCCCHCIFRRALKGERAASWFVRNILFTKIDANDEHHLDREQGVQGALHGFDQAIQDEYKLMGRVKCCARLVSKLCPCCVKLENVDKDVPSKEAMTKAALTIIKDRVAAQHLPAGRRKDSIRLEISEDEVFDWERHEHTDDKTGKVRAYYYNPKTDVSTWDKPRVVVRRTGNSAAAMRYNSSTPPNV